jgi:NAD(P)-dependent dehydrogenase (short-subunit alcohol dehydrogenase family)
MFTSTQYRPLKNQVVVITGASSGIGRATALELARRGARVAVAARDGEALDALARSLDMNQGGGVALAVTTDVTDFESVRRLAHWTRERFGRIDTWINNAAESLYATVEDTTPDEYRRLFEVNFLGMVHGVLAALPIFREQGGGHLVHVGSALSYRGVPYQAAYSATKHALKALTEVLRVELKSTLPDAAVSLVLPGSIDTPLFENARSKIGTLPKGFPPVYAPEVVARVIARVCERPRREVLVGSGAKGLAWAQRLSPALVDWMLVRKHRGFRLQESGLRDDGLDNFRGPLRDRSRLRGRQPARNFSVTTEAPLRRASMAVVASAALGAAAYWAARRGHAA